MKTVNTTYRIDKVKVNQERVYLEYRIHRREDLYDEYVLNSIDPPLDSFRQALLVLRTCVAEICELPTEYQEGLKVTGVTFTWTDDVMGAIITAYKSLQSIALGYVINTPHLPEKPYAKGAGGATLSEEQTKKLRRVLEEAVKYLDGERMQEGLFEAQAGGRKKGKNILPLHHN